MPPGPKWAPRPRYADAVPTIDRCPECPYQGKAIGPRGDPESRLILVGEAPGQNEVAEEQPFVRRPSRAGGVLWDALDEVGLSEDGIFITNAVACQPHPVKPKVASINACRPRLVHDIERAPRAVVMTLGATAFRAVTEERGFLMRDIRGRQVDTTWGPLIPTIHPASVLHQPREGPMLVQMLVEHLRRARRLAFGTGE